MDVDHDGTLDLEEFKAMAIKMGVKMTQPEMGDVSQKRTASPSPPWLWRMSSVRRIVRRRSMQPCGGWANLDP